jgi:hypothetical protein
MTDRCDGRYPVPHKREEPFPVTYRCALPMGHDGPHGDGNDRSEPIEQPAQDRLQPMAPGAPDIHFNDPRYDVQTALSPEDIDEALAMNPPPPPGAPDIPAPTSKEKRAFMEGWRHGYYDGGEHDCRMFKPTAERAWQDYLSERRK